MKILGEITRSRGCVVLVTRDQYRGSELLSIREWNEFTPGDPDTRRPSTKGVTVPVRDIPALRAALEAAEADALQAGLLSAREYINAGLPVPDALRKSA